MNTTELDKILMDAVYDSRWKTMYHAEVYIGLDPEFMVKAHLLIPEGEENILYSWMLNFQYMSDQYVKMYKSSKLYDNEPDIYCPSGQEQTGQIFQIQTACVISIQIPTVQESLE